MIQMPYDQIIEKICEKSGQEKDAVEAKVKVKLEQLTNLVSKEGAAHIVANELGIKLFEATGGKMKIKGILSGMRNVEVLGKVRAVYEVREFSNDRGDGKVGSFMVADETGLLRVTCWHEQADKMKNLKEGDIVKLTNAYARENQGRVEVHLNDKSNIEVDPPGETVEVNEEALQKRAAATRKSISELSENDANVELLGTIVQVYDLRFFETCPECKKRIKPKDGVLACEQHGAVEPLFSYVMNVFVDDGTENIRAVFFRAQVEKLLGKTREEVVSFKEDPSGLENVKMDLLGKIIKLNGRVTRNAMFDRLEFIANEVVVDPDPQDEVKRLNVEK